MKAYQSLLASTTNTRDLGGYPAAGGRTTARGRLWRSDAPVVPDEADASRMRGLGITTVIDLRTDAEAERKPNALCGAEGFDYRRIPITVGSVPPATPEEVPLSYLQIALSRETVEVLRTVAEAPAGVMICCTAGKDRTGVISALLLLACGVDRETIAADYALSREYNRERLERYLAEHPGVDRRVVLADEACMERFLDLFSERFGGIGAFFAHSGLTAAHFGRIRALLLDAETSQTT